MQEGRALPELFRDVVRDHGDAVAIREGPREIRFHEFDAASDRVAAWLAARGLGPGTRVGLLAVNGAAFALAYYGIVKAGATVVPVNTLLTPREIAYILNDAGAAGLFYHPLFAEAAAALRADCPGVRHWAAVGDGAPLSGDPAWAEVLGATGEPPRPAFRPREDTAAILYTSGTTGAPKGAMLSHANLASNIRSACRALDLHGTSDRLLVVLPMFHAFAATVGMLLPLHTGGSFVPLPRFDPQGVADAIAASGATLLPAVPSMYALFLRLPESETGKFASLRFCISGAAPLPLAVMEAFEARFGKPIYEGDGPTECSPVTCVNPIGGRRKPGSVGLPVPDVEMSIRDGDGKALPDGETGEICVRGPNVMQSYWHRPEETAAAFFGEWFRTGDLGYRDADGYFFIVDRIKDLIIVNGMNVYPRVVEEVLYRHPAVAEVAVVGEPHPLHGEIPVAHVVLKAGQAADAQALRRHCQAHLGRHQVPRKFFFTDALPKNAAGKILKRALRAHGELERGVDSRRPGDGG